MAMRSVFLPACLFACILIHFPILNVAQETESVDGNGNGIEDAITAGPDELPVSTLQNDETITGKFLIVTLLNFTELKLIQISCDIYHLN